MTTKLTKPPPPLHLLPTKVQILQVLVPRPRCHGDELFRFVRRIFPVYYFGEKEVAEGRGFFEKS